MLSLGYSTAITAARLGHAPPGAPAPLAFLALPLMGITATLILVVAALLNRRRSDWHKRLMVAAMITLTPPGTARIFVPLGLAPEAVWLALGIVELLLAVGVDLRLSRARPRSPGVVVCTCACRCPACRRLVGLLESGLAGLRAGAHAELSLLVSQQLPSVVMRRARRRMRDGIFLQVRERTLDVVEQHRGHVMRHAVTHQDALYDGILAVRR